MGQEDLWNRFPAARGRLSHRQIDNEKVVLDLDRGTFFTLTEVAAFVWDRIDGRRTAEQLLNEVIEQYDVAELVARADLQELIEDLVREGLIELRDAPPATA